MEHREKLRFHPCIEDKTQIFSLQNLETLPLPAEGGRMGQAQDEQGVL